MLGILTESGYQWLNDVEENSDINFILKCNTFYSISAIHNSTTKAGITMSMSVHIISNNSFYVTANEYKTGSQYNYGMFVIVLNT